MHGLRQIDGYVTGLADTIGAVGCLIFYRRIPPTRQVDNMIGGGKRQTDTACLGRQNHRIEAAAACLKGIDSHLALVTRNATVDTGNIMRQIIAALDFNCQYGLHGKALTENERFFITGLDAVEHRKKAIQPSGLCVIVGLTASHFRINRMK